MHIKKRRNPWLDPVKREKMTASMRRRQIHPPAGRVLDIEALLACIPRDPLAAKSMVQIQRDYNKDRHPPATREGIRAALVGLAKEGRVEFRFPEPEDLHGYLQGRPRLYWRKSP